MSTTSDAAADLASVGLIPLLADSVDGAGVDLIVSYGGRALTRGETLPAASAADPPSISFAGKAAAGSYTLLCVDPHAPSPQRPTMASWLHALVVDAPSVDPARGTAVVPYAPPSPPKGKHAYVWLAYRQPHGPLAPTVRQPKARSKFQTKAWAQDHGLGAPAAATFFWVDADEE